MGGTTGYRVGGQCFTSAEAATDYLMSQVVPTIDQNGTLQHPVKQGVVWHYGGQKVALTLPACNPSEDFEDGLTVGVEVVALMFIAFVIRQAVGLFRLAGGTREGEDE